MSRLVWDKVGEKLYETGAKMAVLYRMDDKGQYPKGVAWNGLTGVSESPSGAESNKHYADDQVYLNITSKEEYAATIEAFTYPDEFAECDGSVEIVPGVYAGQQDRKTFGFCYRSVIGNDTNGTEYGYKLHLVYGCKASPSQRDYATIGDTTEPMNPSWEVSTTPVEITKEINGKRPNPTACLTFDSTKVDKEKLKALEDILYGKDPTTEEANDGTEPRLPLPDEIIELMSAA